jgi:2'-5' RNA ligase
MSVDQPSFVMTLKLDDASFTILQEWRSRYFPAKLNRIPAHLTLLHTVSAEQVCRLRASWQVLQRLAPIPLRYVAARFLGNGVAIDIDSAELHARRAHLLDVIRGSLTRQDQRPFRPHVTIQNKVAAEEARALYKSIGSSFEPWHGEGTALLIWQYLGGPWQSEFQLAFNGVALRQVPPHKPSTP